MKMTREQCRQADAWWQANKNSEHGKRIAAVCASMNTFLAGLEKTVLEVR